MLVMATCWSWHIGYVSRCRRSFAISRCRHVSYGNMLGMATCWLWQHVGRGILVMSHVVDDLLQSHVVDILVMATC